MLVSLLFITLMVSVLLIIRHIFLKLLLPAIWLNRLWYFLFLVLALPFIPIQAFTETARTSSVNELGLSGSHEPTFSETSSNTITDLTVSVARFDLGWIEPVLFTFWLVGMVLFSATLIRSILRLRAIIKVANPVADRCLIEELEKSIALIGLKQKPVFLESATVQSPLTCGWIRPYLLIPTGMQDSFSEVEIRHMLLHELQHQKLHHSRLNLVSILFLIVYWFHPLIWFARKKMIVDRELACDAAVIESIGVEHRKAYGKTLLHFIEKNGENQSVQLGVGGTKKQIEERIRSIVRYRPSSRRDTMKGCFFLLLLTGIICWQTPFLAQGNQVNNGYEFEQDNAIYENLAPLFKGMDGSFVLYSENNDQYVIHNQAGSEQRYSPNSTFKIYSALIGLEQAIIEPSTTLTWGGTNYEHEEWNQNQTMSSAMQHSVNWYFEHIEEAIADDVMQDYVSELDYGNQAITGDSPFWLESSLQVSPIEQVDVLNNFYHNQHGFKPESIDAVKNALRLAATNEAILYGKTGTGLVNEKAINGWFIGFVETAEDTWFFATHVEGEDGAWGQTAAEVTNAILIEKDIIKEGTLKNE